MKVEDKARGIAEEPGESELLRRRDFLKSLRKWSQVVIGGAVLGALLPAKDAEARWGWVNRRGGGGAGWVNGGVNRGGSWINSGGGGWVNHGGWVNRGGSWVNGGGGWVNRWGGGGWINRY